MNSRLREGSVRRPMPTADDGQMIKYGTGADGNARNIPNSYEMPRNSLDLSFGKKFGHWELKASVRDILAERYLFKQIEEVVVSGQKRHIEETTRSYKPGRNFNLSITYSF